MKKYIALLLALLLVMALCLTGCGKEATPTYGEISALVENGYQNVVLTYGDEILTAEFVSEDHTDFKLVSCEMNDKQYKQVDALDYSAEDCDVQLAALLDGIEGVIITDLNEYIPDLTEIESYIGKPLAELEDAGYWQSTLGNDDDGLLYFVYSNDEFSYSVYTEGGYEALFDLPDNFTELNIEKVAFYDFDFAEYYSPLYEY